MLMKPNEKSQGTQHKVVPKPPRKMSQGRGGTAPACTCLVTLPTELQIHILSFLDTKDHFAIIRVCRLWKALLQSSSLLKTRYSCGTMSAAQINEKLKQGTFGELSVHYLFRGHRKFVCTLEDSKITRFGFNFSVNYEAESAAVVDITDSDILDDPLFYPRKFYLRNEEKAKSVADGYMDVRLVVVWSAPRYTLEDYIFRIKQGVSVKEVMHSAWELASSMAEYKFEPWPVSKILVSSGCSENQLVLLTRHP